MAPVAHERRSRRARGPASRTAAELASESSRSSAVASCTGPLSEDSEQPTERSGVALLAHRRPDPEEDAEEHAQARRQVEADRERPAHRVADEQRRARASSAGRQRPRPQHGQEAADADDAAGGASASPIGTRLRRWPAGAGRRAASSRAGSGRRVMWPVAARLELRLVHVAHARLEARAARVEPAAAGRVDRARHVALEHDRLAAAGQSGLGIGMAESSAPV